MGSSSWMWTMLQACDEARTLHVEAYWRGSGTCRVARFVRVFQQFVRLLWLKILMIWPADSGSPFAWKIRVVSSGVSKEASLFNRTRSGFERSYMTLGGFAWRSRFKNTPLLHASRHMDHGTELIPRIRASWKYQLSDTTKTSGWMVESSRAMGEYLARQI